MQLVRASQGALSEEVEVEEEVRQKQGLGDQRTGQSWLTYWLRGW